ncbi:uncharacterized protein LOC114975165 [Acropora millepora]|uniref:uncharacterized protein LOC114975165 n=1 Tax=Acropora millepora TaxID=45264 RepID=UPI001CF4A363|nr:uncharacterized protein LOC114975165 [Acropora millepora]
MILSLQITKTSFLNMEFKDLEVLGVKYFSDRKRLIDAQRTLKGKDLQGKGNRTDINNLEASRNVVEQWRKKRAPFQGSGIGGKKKKEFHVTEMCFHGQNQVAAVKGKIPQMVSSVPALAVVKLACWNQFQDRDDHFLRDAFKISITDNTKKKNNCPDQERCTTDQGNKHWLLVQRKGRRNVYKMLTHNLLL